MAGPPPHVPRDARERGDADRAAPRGLPRVREPVQRRAVRDGLPVPARAAAHGPARPWLAAVAWCVLVSGPLEGEPFVSGLVRAALLLLVLARGGLLALACALFVVFSIPEAPFTLDLSAWYAARALPALLVLVGLAAYAFHTSLGGKPMFRGALLDE